MNGIGTDIRHIAHQAIENVDTLVGSARYEMAEECDVFVRYVVVANAPIAAVADMVFGQHVLLVEIPLCSICRRVFSGTPICGKFKLIVGIDDGGDRLIQGVFRHVFQVEPCNLLATHAFDGARGLLGTQVAAITKESGQQAHPNLFQTAIGARDVPEMFV